LFFMSETAPAGEALTHYVRVFQAMPVIRHIPYHSSVVAVRAHLNESHLATPDVIAPLRHAVADYASEAGMTADRLDDIRLAVSEAVTNVVRHAYPGEQGQVHLTVRLVENELWVLVADDGCGLGVPSVDPGLGWGLAFITDACDEFTLAERGGGGAEARMIFRLRADAASVTDSSGH
jgi:serine/threonine-protein kinase RsbW